MATPRGAASPRVLRNHQRQRPQRGGAHGRGRGVLSRRPSPWEITEHCTPWCSTRPNTSGSCTTPTYGGLEIRAGDHRSPLKAGPEALGTLPVPGPYPDSWGHGKSGEPGVALCCVREDVELRPHDLATAATFAPPPIKQSRDHDKATVALVRTPANGQPRLTAVAVDDICWPRSHACPRGCELVALSTRPGHRRSTGVVWAPSLPIHSSPSANTFPTAIPRHHPPPEPIPWRHRRAHHRWRPSRTRQACPSGDLDCFPALLGQNRHLHDAHQGDQNRHASHSSCDAVLTAKRAVTGYMTAALPRLGTHGSGLRDARIGPGVRGNRGGTTITRSSHVSDEPVDLPQ